MRKKNYWLLHTLESSAHSDVVQRMDNSVASEGFVVKGSIMIRGCQICNFLLFIQTGKNTGYTCGVYWQCRKQIQILPYAGYDWNKSAEMERTYRNRGTCIMNLINVIGFFYVSFVYILIVFFRSFFWCLSYHQYSFLCPLSGCQTAKWTSGGTRTRNPLLRRQMPYPLGHRG